MRFVVLGSGSGGNAAVVEAAGVRVLVDAGLSAKQLTLRMKACGVEAHSLNAILLTHEHGDHTSGLSVLMKNLGVPIYATPSTSAVIRDGSKKLPPVTWRIFESGATFKIGDLEISSFAVPHDAVEPVGFVFRSQEKSLGLLTDTGHVTRLITERLRGVQSLYVEANYCDHLLADDTKRPWSTKQRISSRHGHLSNRQAAELVAELHGSGLSRVVLGHLSRDCNDPNTAMDAIRSICPGISEIACAAQDQPCGWWE